MIPKNIQIGFINIHLYGLTIALAILIAWRLALKRASFYKISKQKLESVSLLIPLVLGIVGGRLYHVVDLWPYYLSNPQQIIRVDQGGLGIWGALIGIFIGLWVFARVEKINLLNLLDLLSPSILLAQGVGRIGNFINQEGFGPPTNLPWGIIINGTLVHPTFFYEMCLDFIFATLLLYLAPKLNKRGQIFGLYLIFYGAIRFVVERYRIDTWTINTHQVAYILSVVSILTGLVIIFNSKTRLSAGN